MPTVANRFRQPWKAPLDRLRHKRRPPTAKERLISAVGRLCLKAGTYVRRRRAPAEGD
jgi:hypothetical protein